MLRSLTLAFCLSVQFLVAPVRAQVCSGDITLTSQGEVNAFNCSEVEGNLLISGGASITDLSPLSELIGVGNNLAIVTHRALESLSGLENLSSVGGSLRIASNQSSLGSLTGLEGLESIGGDLEIEFNSLQSLAGLGSLTSVGGRVYIEQSVESLGLQNLTTVGEGFSIVGNPYLEELAGLESLASIGEFLSIRYNSSLRTCVCGLGSLISGDPPTFSGVQGEVYIGNNDPDGTCTSPEVVLATPCEPVGNEDDSAAPQKMTLEVYPNPVGRVATLHYTLPEAGPVRLAVYDLLGREVAVLAEGVQPVGRHEVRLSGLAAGTYIVRIEVDDGEEVLTRRVTVVN